MYKDVLKIIISEKVTSLKITLITNEEINKTTKTFTDLLSKIYFFLKIGIRIL
jgi:hypothetical protein